MVCTLLIAPQTTEFGAKVGLLGGLVVMTSVRYVFERALPEKAVAPAQRDTLVERLVAAVGERLDRRRTFLRGAVLGSVLTLAAAAVVVAGAPARQAAQASVLEIPSVEIEVDPATLPPVTVGSEVEALNSAVATGGGDDLALALAEDLMIEAEAMSAGGLQPAAGGRRRSAAG